MEVDLKIAGGGASAKSCSARMTGLGELNQLVKKGRKGQTACGPQAWVHRSRRESGQAVQFVDPNCFALRLDQKVDSGHAASF